MRTKEIPVALPDGTQVSFGTERFMCMEEYISGGYTMETGLIEMIFNSIQHCNPDYRQDLFSNIVLCGGVAQCPGLLERVSNGLKEMTEHEVKVTLVGQHSTWVGGSILGSLPTLQEFFVSREKYDEAGAAVVHRCFSDFL